MLRSYFNSSIQRYASKWLVLGIDLFTVSIAFVLSYLIRFNLTFNFDVDKLKIQVPLILVVTCLAFLITGSYKGVIRHTGVKDVYNLFNAICLSSILIILTVLINRFYGIYEEFKIPLSIIIIYSFISFVILSASRYLYKHLYYTLRGDFKLLSKNVLIFGAGESGITTYNALANHSRNKAKVIGYIDDDRQKIGKQINGVKVFGSEMLTEDFILKNKISEIIFSIHNIDPKKLRNYVESLVDFPVVVKIVPPVEAWINGELKASQIKQVQIEDLLNRAPILIQNSRISEELKDKVILVTGAAGSIGSELVRQITHYPYRSLIIVDLAESALYDIQQELRQLDIHNFIPLVADIRDKNRMNTIFDEYRPDLVFHAAAYKHVPLMEYNPYPAIKTNIAGTKVIADLSVQYKVSKFVFVSTDKAVNPTNVMGATKRIAELYISCKQQEEVTKFITTRFGNVLGSNGSVIPLFKKQINKGGPLTVTHEEVTRFFMTIPEASQLVLEAGAMGIGGELFIFDMGESIKIMDLAKNMIKLSGLRYPEDIDIKITGLRPGEKLYEELLANGENTLPTYHKKILISKVRDFEFADIRTKIDELCVTNMFFTGNTVKLMKEIVPEYISKNSEFSKLDHLQSAIDENTEKEEVLRSHLKYIPLHLLNKTLGMDLTHKNVFFRIGLIIIGLSTLSCASKKEVVYFQDAGNFETLVDKGSFASRFKVDDLLSIHVATLNPEASAPFNLVQGAEEGGLRAQQVNYLIDKDGEIDFPVIGKLKVSGLTPDELRLFLRTKLADYLKDPIINIRLKNFTITVLGEVRQPGTYAVNGERITIFEALGLAGDLTIKGIRDNVLVIRDFDGTNVYTRIDLTKKSSLESPVYYLTQNDVVYVEPNQSAVTASSLDNRATIAVSIASLLITSTIFIITRN